MTRPSDGRTDGGVGALQPVATTATVYIGGGRRWFTLRAACRAIARQRLYARYRASGDLEEIAPDDLGREIDRRAKLYERRYRRRVALRPPGAPAARAEGERR